MVQLEFAFHLPETHSEKALSKTYHCLHICRAQQHYWPTLGASLSHQAALVPKSEHGSRDALQHGAPAGDLKPFNRVNDLWDVSQHRSPLLSAAPFYFSCSCTRPKVFLVLIHFTSSLWPSCTQETERSQTVRPFPTLLFVSPKVFDNPPSSCHAAPHSKPAGPRRP